MQKKSTISFAFLKIYDYICDCVIIIMEYIIYVLETRHQINRFCYDKQNKLSTIRLENEIQFPYSEFLRMNRIICFLSACVSNGKIVK